MTTGILGCRYLIGIHPHRGFRCVGLFAGDFVLDDASQSEIRVAAYRCDTRSRIESLSRGTVY